MRTIKIITKFLFLFMFAAQLKAQDTTKPFYFPHKTGDIWEYLYSEVPYVDTIQNFTIFDSTDSKGIVHITQHARFINPIEPPTILSDTSIFWIDTINYDVFTKRPMMDTALVYKLNGAKGEKWIIKIYYDSSNILGYEMARIIDKWKGSIFGKNTTFMQVLFYSSIDSIDTIGNSVYGSDIIADGFGVISKGGGELAGQINLIGAVINDTLYGDTTKVTGINNKYILPIPDQVKLFQNYPNPFNPSTTISFELLGRERISLIIYDILGKVIRYIIDNQEYPAGVHKINWDGINNNGKRTAGGIYFYRLITDNQLITHSMIELK
ncbi:MAG: T9SS type A sorting domain-containing protein [Ignavibacteriaceae bacterium]|nr:T9SS type A sorting domain-containing protein [Ignavibacteriaceae bacterium]